MRLLVLIVCCLSSGSALGNDELFLGSWEGGDTAAMSIYGSMQISESTISWGGRSKSQPKCRATYTLVPEDYGVEFKDQTGHVSVTSPNSNFKTYLLKIKGGKCTLGISHLRLTLDDDHSTYLAMVEYTGLTQPLGWMHFFRR